jgi:hypothetical protein
MGGDDREGGNVEGGRSEVDVAFWGGEKFAGWRSEGGVRNSVSGRSHRVVGVPCPLRLLCILQQPSTPCFSASASVSRNVAQDSRVMTDCELAGGGWCLVAGARQCATGQSTEYEGKRSAKERA